MDDTSYDDDDRLSTINLTPSEADTGTTDEYGLSHEDDDPPNAPATANEGIGPQAADDDPSGVPEDEDEYSLTDSDAEGAHTFRHAAPEYRYCFARVHLKSRERKRAIEELNARIIELEDRNVRLGQSRNTPRKTQVTWPDRIGSESWERVYKRACMEGNASPNLKKIHPDLNLRKPTNREIQADILQNPSDHQKPRPSDMPVGNITRGKLPRKMPDEIQFQILRHFFDFRGKVVHAISRLDPHHPLDEAPMNLNPRPSYLHRLHVGRAPGRFAKGIKANVQRLQHVEILWIGSQHLTFAINDRGKYTSRRTFSLVWLPEAIRLKTLGVYLPESSEEYRRRQHEPRGIVEHMKRKMQIHPNFRGFRPLRTIQGMDYVYSLRGLDQAEFWDFDRWLDTKERKQPVRDWHFIKDVNNSVRRPKEAGDRFKSQLKNLFPSLSSFEPSDADWDLLLGVLGVVEETPPEDSSSDTDPGSDSDPDSDSDSGSGSDSDSGSNSGSGPRQSRPPSPGSDSGSGSSSDDDSDDDAPSQTIPRHNMGVNSVNNEEDGGPSTGDSQANDLLNNFHLLRLMAVDGDGDGDGDGGSESESESDDGSATIVPDDRSVSGHEVIDLTEDENHENEPNQEIDKEIDQEFNQEFDQEFDQDIASYQISTNGNVEGSLFVSDDGYAPSYTESLTRSPQGNRRTGGCGRDSDDSNDSNNSPPAAESEASLFIGSAPSHIYRTASSTTTGQQNERNNIVFVDLTEEDPTDQFLREQPPTPQDSRKRNYLKLEEDDEEEGDDGGAPGGAKRLCT
ncbi:uncharacterized protein Triagg1_9533 [Trichoderma aggressivum f. europaeum]|uniref:Uncharacterized protein n=1 Tax=Trichoderma aggressivum f. europaeum TaxID=173218 RepID=A0AAE1I8R1_9HYPO|nr:hypothetical protein Triagg1_9533 [Trichoderma aggressivum f. europaeum]